MKIILLFLLGCVVVGLVTDRLDARAYGLVIGGATTLTLLFFFMQRWWF